MSAIDISGLVKTFGHVRALDGLDLTVRPARCTASSAPTAPASRRRSASCSACCAPTPARSRLLGGDPWPDAVELHRRHRLRARRREPVAEPHRRRGDRPARPPARRHRSRTPRRNCVERFELDPTKKAAPYSKGNRQKVALVAGLASDAELLHPRRADVRPRPADGDGLPGVHRRGSGRRAHRAALEPHPRRGRGAVRSREHHPRRPDGRDRDPRRTAPSHAHRDRGRDRSASRTASRRSPAFTTSSVDDHHARFDVDTTQLDEALRARQRARRADAHEPRRRRSRSCSCATTATRSNDRPRHAAPLHAAPRAHPHPGLRDRRSPR